jgi:L-fuconolactonase
LHYDTVGARRRRDVGWRPACQQRIPAVPDFPIIDSHIHLADPGRFTYDWMAGAPSLKRVVLPADLKRAAAPVIVESLVFVEVDVAVGEHVEEARWIDGMASSPKPGEPRVAAVVAALPLERGPAVKGDLDRLLSLKSVRSIRRLIQNQPDPDFCIRPDFIAALKLLAAHDIAFDICVFHHHLPNVIRMVAMCPDVRFVLDHIGKPAIRQGLMEPWRANLSALAKHDNVWCKISGVASEADHRNWTAKQLSPYISHAIDAFGFDRVMFGGDWHVSELAVSYPRWVEVVDGVVAAASADEKRKLYRDNAARFYRFAA